MHKIIFMRKKCLEGSRSRAEIFWSIGSLGGTGKRGCHILLNRHRGKCVSVIMFDMSSRSHFRSLQA